MWYACHAFLYFQYKEGEQSDFVGHENIYLIEADGFDDAFVKGKLRAREDEGDCEGTLTYDDRPVRLTLATILKVVECIDLDIDSGKPVHGTELSYSDITVNGRSEFEKLIAGHSAVVTYHGVNDDGTSDCEMR